MAKDKKKPKATPAKSLFTSGDIYNARHSTDKDGLPIDPLGILLQQKMPIGVGFKLGQLAKAIQPDLAVIEGLRNDIIKEYGVADEVNPNQVTVPTIIEKLDDKGKPIMDKGKPIMIPNPGFAKFLDEVNELMSQEVKMVVEKVKLPEMVASTCDKCSHNMDKALEIEPAVLMLLDKFIEV